MGKTTQVKMPQRNKIVDPFPTVTTIFTEKVGQTTMRIENGLRTELESIVTREFCLTLVGALTAHFDLMPKEICAEMQRLGLLNPHGNF